MFKQEATNVKFYRSGVQTNAHHTQLVLTHLPCRQSSFLVVGGVVRTGSRSALEGEDDEEEEKVERVVLPSRSR